MRVCKFSSSNRSGPFPRFHSEFVNRGIGVFRQTHLNRDWHLANNSGNAFLVIPSQFQIHGFAAETHTNRKSNETIVCRIAYRDLSTASWLCKPFRYSKARDPK